MHLECFRAWFSSGLLFTGLSRAFISGPFLLALFGGIRGGGWEDLSKSFSESLTFAFISSTLAYPDLKSVLLGLHLCSSSDSSIGSSWNVSLRYILFSLTELAREDERAFQHHPRNP